MSSNLQFIRLDNVHDLKSFDCGDCDLNEFFLNDSKEYQKDLIAVTYILESDSDTIAFFSVFNDKITIEDVGSKKIFMKVFSDIKNKGKSFRSYPAVKIGRLGVSEKYSGEGWGTKILNYIKQSFIQNNKTGCKCITVDAYSQSLEFYEKNGFEYLTPNDSLRDTRQMYFDLARISD